jgi:cytoskeletal protein CcmA (bactofilin family)
MFKQNSDENQGAGGSADTTIGPSVKVEGDVNAVGNVLIEGSVNGTITTDKHVVIGAGAEVTADIKADSAEIAGTVKGKLSIAKDLSILTTAQVTGDISTGTLSMEKGAKLNGQITMGSAPVSTPPQQNQQS